MDVTAMKQSGMGEGIWGCNMDLLQIYATEET